MITRGIGATDYGLLTTDSSVLYLRPVNGEVEVRVVRFLVTLHTSRWRCHEAVTLSRVTRMLTTGTVTLLALNVSKLRRRI